MKSQNTTKNAALKAKRKRDLKLQVREHMERYHPELRSFSVEIDPQSTIAVVRRKPRDKSR